MYLLFCLQTLDKILASLKSTAQILHSNCAYIYVCSHLFVANLLFTSMLRGVLNAQEAWDARAPCTGKLQSALNYYISYGKIGHDGILRTPRGQ